MTKLSFLTPEENAVVTPMNPRQMVAYLQSKGEMLGYRFERSADGLTERLIRPDGSVAITAATFRVPQRDRA